MAELLKREYDLFVLKLELQTGAGTEEPFVVRMVEGSLAHQIERFDRWSHTLAELHIPDRLVRRVNAGQTYDGRFDRRVIRDTRRAVLLC